MPMSEYLYASSEDRIDGDVLFSWQCYAPGEQFIHPNDRPVFDDVKYMVKVALGIYAI